MQSHTTITIDTAAPPKPYSRMVFGGFLEHFHKQVYGGVFEPGSPLADEAGFRLDALEALKELRMPVIRWPGGCFVDSYHWQKGIGKVRQPYLDDRWGAWEPNTFGTHEFMELCRRLDAEPYICQNSFATIAEMSDWVAYCNATEGAMADLRKANGAPEPFGVKYWSVGNERGGKEYIDHVKAGALAMKQVDPGIFVTCSGAHGPTTHLEPYLLETAAQHLDMLSVHEYWVPNYHKYHTPDYLACMIASGKPDAHVKGVVESLRQSGMEDKLTIAFDEWNLRGWHSPGKWAHNPAKDVDYQSPEIIAQLKAREKDLEPSLYTMSDALFCASFFNACLRNPDHVKMANISPIVNTTGPLYVHPKGIVRRTHFHTMSMYASLLEANVAEANIKSEQLAQGSESVDMVDAVATVDETGKRWAIALVNRHPSAAVKCTLKLGSSCLSGTVNATLLSGDSPDSYNDIEHPDRVTPQRVSLLVDDGMLSLPPHSLSIVEIPVAAAGIAH